MYCANCGVKLGEGEDKCPLCGLRAYHPDMERTLGTSLYPEGVTMPKVERGGLRILLTISAAIALFSCILVDLLIAKHMTWSGYVIAGIIAGYLLVVLPMWFEKPRWIWFLAMDVVVVECLLVFLNGYTGGHWFLSFGFPVAAIYGAYIITLFSLAKYVNKGWFYILGGACMILGWSTVLVELFEHITFHTRMFLWSLYPAIVLSVLGLFWILAGIIKPLGRMLTKKLFL